MKSSARDVKIAVFYSPHIAGNVRCEYCPHQQMLVLRYRTGSGVMSSCYYDVTKPSEMRSMVLDAISLAAESVERRG